MVPRATGVLAFRARAVGGRHLLLPRTGARPCTTTAPKAAHGFDSGLAVCKTLAKANATCSCLSTVRFATGPKRSMGHVLGAEKGIFFIRGRGRPTVYGGRAGLILSIPVKEVSLGSPRVGTIHVQAPTPHAPALQSFLVDFSQQTTGFSHL